MTDNFQNNNLEYKAVVFKALAHRARLQIIFELSDGSKCVNDLHDVVGGDVSTVSRHISVLKNAGIVSGNKIGLQVFYSLDMICVTDFIACIGSKSTDGQKQSSCEKLRGV